METWRITSAVLGIILVVAYAAGSGFWVSNNSPWYFSLNRPFWQPPNWVFGVIWPYNFIMLGLTSFVVARRLSKTFVVSWLLLFALSVVAALIWSYLFYVPHNLSGAAFALATAALITVPVTAITFRASIGYGIALLPYQVWVIIASTLSVGYAVRN